MGAWPEVPLWVAFFVVLCYDERGEVMAYRVAIVEDEAIVAHSLEQKLVKLGYVVGGVFYRAEDLLDFLTYESVDLILMDIQLTDGMSGIEAAAYVFEHFRIPVVYLTAFSDDVTLERAARTEPYGYLIKPFNDRELKATLEMAFYKAASVRELAYRQARWEAMFVHIREGLVIVDPQGLVVSVNPAMERLSRLSREEMVGKSLDDLFVFLPRAGKGEKMFFLEVKKNGVRVPVLWDSSLMEDEYKTSLGMIHMFHDVSDLVEYEEALIASEYRYRTLLEEQTDWIVRLDEDGRIEYANKPMAAALGWETTQIEGLNFFDIFPLAEKSQWQKVLAQLEAPEDVATLSLAYDRHGIRYVIEWRFRCVHDVKTSCRQFQGVGRDITLLRETEEALRQEDEFLKRILGIIEEGVVMVSEKGEVGFVNARGRELLALEGEKPQYLLDLVTLEREHQVTDFVTLLEEIKRWPTALWKLTNRRQKRYEVMIEVAPFVEGGKREYVLLMTDMTLFNQLQQEFYRAQRLEAMEVLAGGIAHDFNNILTVIMGNISLLRMKLHEPSKDMEENLRDAEEACERAKQLTRQMLSFSRGGVPVIRQENIVQMLEETTRFLLQGSSIRWRIEKHTDRLSVPVDIGQMGQVIQNLVLNAREAMGDGGELVISLRTVPASMIHARVPDPREGVEEYLCVEVRDTGPGMDPALLSRVFEPYVSTKSRGSGLGLAIVYTLVRKHHGVVEVTSEVGQGTSFFIYLPLYEMGEEGEKRADILPTDVPEGKGKRVWVVDDEIGIVKVLEKSLTQRGYEVMSFQQVEDFLERLSEMTSEDILIMDITMPGEISVEKRLERVYAVAPEVGVLLISGYARRDQVLFEHKRLLFLVKPFSVPELLNRVYELLPEHA